MVAATVLFAVIGFVPVSGRAPSTPSAAALAYVEAAVDGDSEAVHDLRVAATVPEASVTANLRGRNSVPDSVRAEVLSQTDVVAPDGRPGVDVVQALTVFGETAQQDVVLAEEDGYRVCGGSLGFG